MSKKKSILDSLCGDLSDDDDEEEEEEEEELKQEAKKPKQEISFEELEERGYKAKSVLLMKAPLEEAPNGWGWSDGRAAKASEKAHETLADRQATRETATRGAEETAMHAIRAQELAAKLQEERRQEKREQHHTGNLRVKDKEKRKRDEGKQSRAKSTVEEEKRIARGLGVYSGFD